MYAWLYVGRCEGKDPPRLLTALEQQAPCCGISDCRTVGRLPTAAVG